MKKADESKNGWTNDRKKSEKQHKMLFWSEKLNKESDQNGRCKKETKKSRMKNRIKEKGRNRKKERHPQHFQENEIFFKKQKDLKKKRRHTNWTQKRCEAQFKIGNTFHKIQNLEKGNQQKNREKKNQGDISKRRFFFFFLMVQEGWKTQNWRCRRGQKIQKKKKEKEKTKKHLEPRKENGTRKTRVQQKEKTKEKRKTQREKMK